MVLVTYLSSRVVTSVFGGKNRTQTVLTGCGLLYKDRSGLRLYANVILLRVRICNRKMPIEINQV